MTAKPRSTKIHVNIIKAWIPQHLRRRPCRCSRCREVQVSPKLAVDDRSDVLLDSKALKAMIGAVHHQLVTWQGVSDADIDEDAIADLHNDIAHLEIIFH